MSGAQLQARSHERARVARAVDRARNPNRWPEWPLLALRKEPDSDPDVPWPYLGRLLDTPDASPVEPKVYLGFVAESIDKKDHWISYSSLEELFKDGWEVV